LIGCGDGRAEGDEECDDGNNIDTDMCDNSCDLNCGNGVVDSLEECDDGNTLNGDTCSNICTWTPICGNGKREVGEACDDVFRDTRGCKYDCSGVLDGWLCFGGS